ncbi:MAG: hypothetical protein LUH15_04000 [Tannerellaceae bacterium]|nr:hypothetical protein [Tannerellaceae bacterium]
MTDVKLSILLIPSSGNEDIVFTKDTLKAAIAGLDSEIHVVNNFRGKEEEIIDSLQGEYVLCMSSRIIVGEDTIRTACFFLDEHPDVGLVGVKMLNGRGAFLPESKQYFPSSWKKMLHKSGMAALVPTPVGKEEHSNAGSICEIPSTPFYLFRKANLEKVKALETAYAKASYEIALADRMRAGGFINYYLPERVLYIKEIPALRPAKPRTLVLGFERDIDAVRKEITKRLPEQEFINLWDLSENRVLDAICRTNKMKQFTTIVFVYPVVRMEQILLFMERMPEKTLAYYIYHTGKELLIATTV